MPSTLDRSIPLLATILFCSAGLGACVGAPPESEDTALAEEALSISKCPDFEGNDSIALPEDQRLWFKLLGVGVQIYTCDATASGHAWVFKAPEAVLLNEGGQQVGTHYAGSIWEHDDGSTVRAVMVPPAYTPDPDAIPWLRLMAVENTGDGKIAEVSYLQRLSTTGGKAPTRGCDADHVGEEARVAYTADYFFYRTGAGNPDGNPRCGD